MRPTRRIILTGLAAFAATPALAHHGWRWTDGGKFELTGIVTHADLGNPHGVLTIETDDELWAVEVGQPWRNDRAGLTDDLLSVGTEMTVIGERSANPEQLRMKAEAIVIAGETYPLYPERL